MTVLADWVYRPITKNIVLGVILSILSIFGIVMSRVSGSEDGVIILTLALIGVVWITVVSCRRKTKVNQEEIPPIYAEEKNLFLYDGESHVKIPVDRIVRVVGKNKRYFHFYGRFYSWGTYNFGKVSVCYWDKIGQKKVIVIHHVYKPEDAADKVVEYMQNNWINL